MASSLYYSLPLNGSRIIHSLCIITPVSPVNATRTMGIDGAAHKVSFFSVCSGYAKHTRSLLPKSHTSYWCFLVPGSQQIGPVRYLKRQSPFNRCTACGGATRSAQRREVLCNCKVIETTAGRQE
jgi:hypothetical protein